MIRITKNRIDECAVLQSVKKVNAGASLLFVGSTREITEIKDKQKTTIRLKYDCYQSMAESELLSLVETAKSRWQLIDVAVVHRIGEVPAGETSVAIAVSSPHRDDSFQAGRWLIDTIKKVVPIWKQENWSDGTEEWVHPLSTTDSEPSLNSNEI